MKNFCQCHLLQSCDPPCVPYLGMYLTDLAFIEEGTPNYTEDGLVNFSKMRMVSSLQQSGAGAGGHQNPSPGPPELYLQEQASRPGQLAGSLSPAPPVRRDTPLSGG